MKIEYLLLCWQKNFLNQTLNSIKDKLKTSRSFSQKRDNVRNEMIEIKSVKFLCLLLVF
jgi:hypothetical protein